MYKIRIITRYEHTWINSKMFHSLFSQLTQSTLLSKDQFQKWFSEIQENPCFTLFGVFQEKSPKLIGVGTLWIQPKYYRNNGNSGYIEDIVIDKNYQKKGLGKTLVKHIIDYAKERKCYKIQLYCNPKLQTFYETIGFKNTTKNMEMYLAV
jgi:GNAT superfamily N-acetyltransferase